ncbi:MAG TPA: hypothetical protein VFA96_02630, partial [Nocardioides sp.]|nr:hypothetical protein [Nocardioides sp.]
MNGRRNRRRVLAIAAVVGLGTLGLVGRAVLPVGSTSDHPGIEEHDDPDMPRFIEGRVDETQYLKARMAHEALLLGSGEVPPQARADAVQEQHAEQAEQARQAQQQPSAEGSAPSDSVAPATTPWTAVGPSPIPNGQIVGSGPVSGRVSAIAIDPTNPSIVYLGAAQGGVFRTLDAGAHWTPIFDSAQTSAIGAITIAPSDHTKVYIGTGESSGSADSYGGVGLYRVDNATTTANLVGPINPTGASQIATGAFTGRGISQILVHPTDPATVFVTTTTGNQGLGGDNTFGGTLPPLSPKGLFRSTNATASLASISFTKLLVTGEGSVDPDTTGNDGIYDMTFAPGDPTTIIAGVNGATAGGLYRLTNVLATDPTTVTSTRTLTVNNTFRFSFSAVSPGGVSTIYAGTPESSGTLRRSNDNGVSWSSPIAGATGFCGGQCFYDLVVAADPTNANIIYVGGSANTNGAAILKKSTDGATFSDASTGLHADTHAIQIAPSPNNATVYTGNDGGVWKSTNSGLAWSDLNSTDLNTTQFQSISVHPTDPKFTIGGTQDNGTQYQNPTGTWTRADFGDGGFSAIDQGAADTTNVTMYHTYFNQKNNLIGFGRVTTVANATDNGWQFFGCGSGTANGINCGDDVQFYAPLVLGPGTPNTVYFGTNKLYRSTNQGLTMNAVSQVFQAGVAVSAIAVSPLNDSVRVVGLKNGKVFATGTGANPMTDVSAGLPTGHYVARIALDPHNVNTAYVALGGYFGGSSSHVWKTTNLTSGSPTWTNASTGIPDVPVNGLVVDPSDSKRVYAGTDIGAYFSSDSGATWAPLGTGLPVVAIFDMAVAKPATGSQVLRIATHGRGIWELPLPTTPGVYESPSPVTPGLSINVSWAGIGTPTSQDWIGVFANPGTADTGTRVAWRFTNGAATGSLPIKIPTGTPAGTTYELRLFSNNAFTKLATSAPFTVAAPTLSATPSPVNPGLSLTATWSGISSPTSQDWIA